MKSTLLLLLALGLANLTHAQAADPKATASETKPAPRHEGITLDFPGGTIATLIAAVNSANDIPVNLIGEKDALAATLPAFSVRKVRGAGLINALVPFIRPQGYLIRQTDENVWFVERMNAENSGRQTSLVVPVNMSPYLDAQNIDDIVAAIRLASEMSPARDNQPLGLKFHPPTKLLLISGSPEAVQVAQTVINSLSRSSLPKPPLASGAAPDKK